MAFSRRDIRGGAVETTLSGAITGTPASFTITSSTGWPDGATGNFIVAVDRPIDGQTNANFEKILCSTRSGETVGIVTRGYDGTSTHDHSAGARVEHSFGAVDFDEANYWVAELAGAADTAGDLVVADGADSLTKLAKGSNSRVLSVDSGGTLGYTQVTSAMIGTDVILAGNIAADAVGSSEIAADAVGTSEIAANAVGSSELADSAVDTAAIVDANVTEAKLAANIINTGDYKWSAQTSSHGNWLKCEGAAVSRGGANAALFALIGTAFGVGDGSTTFNLPDPRGRVAVATGAGSSLTSRALGASGGAETHTLVSGEMPSHTHTQNAHAHTPGAPIVYGVGQGNAGLTIATGGTANADPVQNTTATNQNTGGGGAHANMQPWLAIGSLFIHV